MQNAAVVRFDQIKNFDQLRRKVRSDEYWRSTSTGDNSATKINTAKPEVAGASPPVQHQPLRLDPSAIAQKDIMVRVETLEKDLKY